MPLSKTELQNSINESVSSFIQDHQDLNQINSLIYDDTRASSLNIDQDVANTIRINTGNNSGIWDNFFNGLPEQYYSGATENIIFDVGESALKAQQNLSAQVVTQITLKTTTTVSVETAIVQYFDELPIKAFVEKTTGQIVTTQNVTSATHIPVGQYIAGVGKLVGTAAVVAGFKDTVEAAYAAQAGSGDTFTPLQKYIAAGAGGVGAIMVGAALGPGLVAAAGAAAIGTGIGVIVDRSIGLVRDYVDQSKTIGRSEQEVLLGVEAIIDDVSEQYWESLGNDAVTDQFKGLNIHNELLEAIEQNVNDLEVDQSKILNSNVIKEVDDNVIIEQANEEIFINSNGDLVSSPLDPAGTKISAFDARLADFEANGTVVSQQTGTITQYGVTYDAVTKVIELNGEQIQTLEYTLPSGATMPTNGVTSQKFVSEKDANGQFYIAREDTVFVDTAGRIHTTLEQKDGPDGNWVVQENILGHDGIFVEGETYIIPSADLLQTLQFSGGTVGSMLGGYLADGNAYKDIAYSTFLKTVGQHFGTFTSYFVNENSFQNSLDVAVNGGATQGTAFENQAFSETFFSNLNSKISGVVGGLIVSEVGEALGLDGVAGDVFTTAGNAVTAEFVSEGFDVVFGNLDGTVFEGFADGKFFQSTFNEQTGQWETNFDISSLIKNALASYIGSSLAGDIVDAESEAAGILGSLGSAFGSAIGGGTILSGSSFANLITAGFAGGPIGIAIGAFVGTLAGTVLGNAFGGEDNPSAFGAVRYDYDTDQFYRKFITKNDDGPAELAENMAQSVVSGVNSILAATGGALRHTSVAEALQIGVSQGTFYVDIVDDESHAFGSAGDAIEFAVFHILKSHDLVAGNAVIMRAWHNTEATNMAEWKEDIEVAEAFQQYLLDPTGVLALMMDQPDSDLAQSWAAILQRAAELELHLPHEKDLDGGWNELLLARGDYDPGSIPQIDGDSIVITDPVTGEQTVLHHVIGPGYEIVRVEGTDGDDIIQVIVDGPSITYVDAGAGDDTVTGSEERDIILGGSGDDIIDGLGGDDWINGGSGDDTVHGNGGLDLIYGGDDEDTLYGDEDGDAVYGGQGDDTLYGLGGVDELFGGSGNDVLDGGAGVDLLMGEAGNDTLIGNGGGDTLDGGIGDDIYHLNGSGDIITVTRSSGHETIHGNSTDANTIRFDETIGLYEIWFEASGDDLVIKILGEDQSLTVKNMFVLQGPTLFTFEWTNQFSLPGVSGLHDSSSQLYAIAHANASYAGKPSGQYNYMSNAEFDGSVYQTINWTSHQPDPKFFGNNSSNNYTITQEGGGGGGIFFFGGAGGDNTNAIDHSSITRDDYVYGDSGNDDLETGFGNDLIVGGLGDDMIRSNNDADRVWGGSGNDTIYGGGADDLLYGGIGEDFIEGGYQNDTIYGGEGDDELTDLDGSNYIYGESGNDTITITTPLITAGDNYLDGGEGDDVITAHIGDDTIFGGSGNDILDGGAGADFIDGGEGDDRLIYNYAENVGDEDEYVGGQGNDTLVILLTAAEFALNAVQRDLLRFEARINANENTTTSAFLAFSFALQALGLSSVEAMEVIVDGNIQDLSYIDITGTITTGETLSGGSLHDHIIGLEGDDTLNGGSGHDFLEGASGNDVINGEEGSDDISGGDGDDTISGGADDDTINGNAGDDVIHGDAGADVISAGDGADNVDGGSESDTIYGGLGDDILNGGDGDDELYGESGSDTLIGGAGNDLLNGDTGDDTLIGGLGNDYLDGGIGNDEYIFNLGDGVDTINDVSGTQDYIRFGPGILKSDISVSTTSNNGFAISLAQNTTDLIIIENQGTIGAPRLSVEKLIFDSADEYDLFLNIQNDSKNMYKNTSAILDVTANDTDILQDLLFVESTTQGENGSVVINADGTLTYTPDTDFIGQDSFTYSATDWFGNLQTATVSINVKSGIIEADGALNTSTIDVLPTLTGYTSSEGTLTFSGENTTGEGTIIYNAWRALDGVVSGSSNPWNDKVEGEEWIAFEFNDSKIVNKYTLSSGGYASYVPDYAPKDWTLQASNDGSSWVTLDSRVNETAWGMHETRTFTFLNDQAYTHYKLYITANNINDQLYVMLEEWELFEAQINEIAPIAVNDAFASYVDAVITGNLLADNGNGADYDPESDILSIQAKTIVTTGGATVVVLANGDFTYTPSAGFIGSDSFNYTLSDGNGGSDTATVSVTVNPVNDNPIAVDDSVVTDEGVAVNFDVRSNDSDIDNDVLNAFAWSLPANGGLVLNGDGSFTYTPDAGFTGTNSFNYRLDDGNGGEDFGTVNITVNAAAPSNAPLALNPADFSSYNYQQAGDYDSNWQILNNGLDIELNGNTWAKMDFAYTVTADTVLEFDYSSSQEGEIQGIGFEVDDTWIAGGSVNEIFHLFGTQANTVTHDDFTYTGAGSTQHFTIDVGSFFTGSFNYLVFANDHDIAYADAQSLFSNIKLYESTGSGTTNTDPVAVDDTVEAVSGQAVTFNVMDNDSDVDGDVLNAYAWSLPANGSLQLNGDKTFTYTPDAGFTGTNSFRYKLVDGNGGEDFAWVTFNVSETGGGGYNVINGTSAGETLNGTAANDEIHGMEGNDLVYGNDGEDLLKGGAGNDYLYGNDGDDILYAGAGNDVIRGQAGSDIFVFESADAFNGSNQINDFSLTDGDKIDLSDVLFGYDPLVDAIEDFVKITDVGTSASWVSVDADGGGDNFVQMATLLNIQGLTDEAALEASGTLITV